MARARRRRRPRAGALGSVSRQDFNAVAAALCRAQVSGPAVEGIADYFATKNKRFNRGRFLAAAKCETG